MSRLEQLTQQPATAPRPLRAKQVAPPKPESPARNASPHKQPSATHLPTRVIRVLCVDDHAVLIEGLKAQFAIDGELEVVGSLGSADTMVQEAQRLRPDAILLDVEMPGADAFEAAERLRRTCPEVRVMILSAHVRDGFISAAYNAGASAYFAKSDEVSDIVDGVREMVSGARGAFVLGPRVLERCSAPAIGSRTARSRERLSQQAESGTASAPLTMLDSLTSREAEILRLIGKGYPRTKIAAELCRSVKTIDGHQDRLMRKLGIGSRADLMRFAIREGLALA